METKEHLIAEIQAYVGKMFYGPEGYQMKPIPLTFLNNVFAKKVRAVTGDTLANLLESNDWFYVHRNEKGKRFVGPAAAIAQQMVSDVPDVPGLTRGEAITAIFGRSFWDGPAELVDKTNELL